HELALHQSRDPTEIGTTVLVPLRHEYQRLGAAARFVAAVGREDPLAVVALDARTGGRIVHHHLGTTGEQPVDELESRRVADVVGAGLEGRTPHGHAASPELSVEATP